MGKYTKLEIRGHCIEGFDQDRGLVDLVIAVCILRTQRLKQMPQIQIVSCGLATPNRRWVIDVRGFVQNLVASVRKYPMSLLTTSLGFAYCLGAI
jgi:hypothetical protein